MHTVWILDCSRLSFKLYKPRPKGTAALGKLIDFFTVTVNHCSSVLDLGGIHNLLFNSIIFIVYISFIFVLQSKEKKSNRQTQQNSGSQMTDVIIWSALIPILLSNTIHLSSNLIFSYNLNYFLVVSYPGVDAGVMVTVTTLVAALPGCVLGCMLADYMVKKYGVTGRIWLALTVTVRNFIKSYIIQNVSKDYHINYGHSFM